MTTYGPLFDLTGRRALVVGASGALGTHFARVLHAAGAAVALAARRLDRTRALAEDLVTRAVPFARPIAMPVAMDVTDPASVRAAFDAAETALGGAMDVIINGAGIAVTKPVLHQTPEDWDSVLSANLRGPFLVAQEAARRLVAANAPGVIVNVASILGERIIPGVAGYTASKAALLHLTRQMAVELARHRIRVNALAPGYVATDINADFFASDAGQAMIRRIPQRRLGTVDDLTAPLLLLASDAGAGMTGTTLTVDGGHSISSL